MNDPITSSAESAWMNAKGSPARSVYIAGYEQGALDERDRVAQFLSDNMPTLMQFAGPRAPELFAFMFREMKPDWVMS